VREPRQVLAEFGLDLMQDIKLVVHDSNADMRYLVLPEPPHDVERYTISELETMISRDHLIGVARGVG
jgi:nitrile hydratase